MGTKLRQEATKLRKQGWSYNTIVKKLGVPKSTLSGWLHGIPYSPNATVIKRMKAGPMKSGLRRHVEKIKKTREIHEQAKRQVGTLTTRDLFILGIGLYIGEGSKQFEQTQIINADARVLKSAMAWFQTSCHVPKSNLRFTIYTYPDISLDRVMAYWVRTLRVSKSQFCRACIDQRTNKSKRMQGKLPFGTVRISVNSCGNIEFGVNLHRRIMGWIDATHNQAGIV